MLDYIIRKPQGFPTGLTSITKIGDQSNDTGIHFAILKLRKGESHKIHEKLESAYLLMQGTCLFQYESVRRQVSRHSLFDEEPKALHLPSGSKAGITAISDCELAIIQVENMNWFTPCIYDAQNMLENEMRGSGILDDTACRVVRTIFDSRNAPLAKLVLGEVITSPGRWSSYPPHHHPHPEIYHYRFTEPQGYGHAECGDEVYKVQQFDTYKIIDSNDHAQTAAPGYGMYYLWIIRHLENNPYITPEYTQAHNWTRSKSANTRVWKKK